MTPDGRIRTLATDGDRAYQLCRCEICGSVDLCTPRCDYYERPGCTGLACEGCMRRAMHEIGGGQ